MTRLLLKTPVPSTTSDFRVIARQGLHLEPKGEAQQSGPAPISPSDFDLNPGVLADLAAGRAGFGPAKPAAVLVPAIQREEITLLFTQRTAHLAAHAGQIAFPGGKAEPADGGPLATALREAHEEIGLEPDYVEPLGYLDCYRTGTGYCITPVVALVDSRFTLKVDPNEVADVFEVPLAFLMDKANHQLHARTIGESERRFYAMPFGDRFIWGATAGILRNMHERLFSL